MEFQSEQETGTKISQRSSKQIHGLRFGDLGFVYYLNFHSLPSDQASRERGALKEASDVCATLKGCERNPDERLRQWDGGHPTPHMCSTLDGFLL